MGAIFSHCFRSEDSDDRHHNINPAPFNLSTSVLAQACSNLFLTRQHQQHITSASSTSTSPSPSTTTCDTFRSPPPPLPYNNLKGSPQRQDHGLHSKQGNKGSRLVGMGEKLNVFDNQNECKLENLPDSSVKKPSKSVIIGSEHTLISSDDDEEEVSCPICLEEYTDDNPCITMLCSHEFHLGCLCEWMERSDDCPICGKVMIFSEAC